MFSDPDFPPNNNSIYHDPRRPTSEITGLAGWKRVGEICSNPQLFVDGANDGDVKQGGLGDCWFIGALAVIADHPDLINRLVVSAHPEQGFYQFRFYKEAQWVTVSIDDYIPVNSSGKPIFGRCKDPNETWVMLLEKAYAKLHKSYEAIIGGSVANALVDLTGGTADKLFFGPRDENHNVVVDGSLWDVLARATSDGVLLGCASSQGGSEEPNSLGILSGHAYSILEVREACGARLLRIRNPWGDVEWKGPWSDGSAEWTPRVLSEMNYSPDIHDGSFWMCYEDFVEQYNKLYMCRLFPDKMRYSVTGSWQGPTAGGCTNTPRWKRNPQFYLESQSQKIFISLKQEDIRMQGDRAVDYETIGFYVLKADDPGVLKTEVYVGDAVAKTTFTNVREVTLELEESGAFNLVPCTFEPGINRHFALTIASDQPINFGPIGGAAVSPDSHDVPPPALTPPSEIKKRDRVKPPRPSLDLPVAPIVPPAHQLPHPPTPAPAGSSTDPYGSHHHHSSYGQDEPVDPYYEAPIPTDCKKKDKSAKKAAKKALRAEERQRKAQEKAARKAEKAARKAAKSSRSSARGAPSAKYSASSGSDDDRKDKKKHKKSSKAPKSSKKVSKKSSGSDSGSRSGSGSDDGKKKKKKDHKRRY
eukprot:gnl/Spiro4/11844_TR6248_c0_g1_i1.p1 gnl/Spiro4/11844_TR6248_c0_g1~~gnl/Spiro4/11844_TR6248_c0_g1_i1.p1  ORF type:complete len:668 (-),score=152.08 gnl/Spiro4/11844_TR6248_c0_g1_i1:54-1985(-)